MSLKLIAVWLLCFTPTALALLGIAEVINIMFQDTGSDINTVKTYLIVCLQAAAEILVTGLSSVSIAYGIQSLYSRKQK